MFVRVATATFSILRSVRWCATRVPSRMQSGPDAAEGVADADIVARSGRDTRTPGSAGRHRLRLGSVGHATIMTVPYTVRPRTLSGRFRTVLCFAAPAQPPDVSALANPAGADTHTKRLAEVVNTRRTLGSKSAANRPTHWSNSLSDTLETRQRRFRYPSAQGRHMTLACRPGSRRAHSRRLALGVEARARLH